VRACVRACAYTCACMSDAAVCSQGKRPPCSAMVRVKTNVRVTHINDSCHTYESRHIYVQKSMSSNGACENQCKRGCVGLCAGVRLNSCLNPRSRCTHLNTCTDALVPSVFHDNIPINIYVFCYNTPSNIYVSRHILSALFCLCDVKSFAISIYFSKINLYLPIHVNTHHIITYMDTLIAEAL